MSEGDRRKSSFSDAELFGNGEEESSLKLRRTISREGKKKQAQFRTSKNDKEFEVESDKEADDVFEETDSNTSVGSGRRTERSKSDSLLPDVVLSSSSTRSDGEFETSVNSEDSPDVVGRKFSQIGPGKEKEESLGEGDENRSVLGPLTTVTKGNPQKFKRSVSFQDVVKPRTDSKSNSDTENRRKEYRRSSGYGTGGSNTSLQSQQSAVSNCSQESEGNGLREEHQKDISLPRAQEDVARDTESQGSGLPLMYEGDKNSVRIIQRGRPLHQTPGSNGGHIRGIGENGFPADEDVDCIDDDDDDNDVQNLIPAVVTSILNQPSIEESPGPIPNLSIMGTISMEFRDPFIPEGGSNYSLSEGVDPGANIQSTASGKACEKDSYSKSFEIKSHFHPEGGSNNFPSERVDQGSNIQSTASSKACDKDSYGKSFEIKSPFHPEGGSNNFPSEGVDSGAISQTATSSIAHGKDSDDRSHDDSSVMLPDFNLIEPVTPNIEKIMSPSMLEHCPKEKLREMLRQVCEPPHTSPSQPPSSAEFRIPDHIPLTPDVPPSRPAPSTGHSSYGVSYLLSAFLKNPHIFNFDMDNLQNLLKVYNGTPTSCPVTEEGSMVPDVSVPCVEIASRCKDKDCQLRKCQVMKAAMIGLLHTLDGFLNIHSSPEVQNLCLSLFGHARNCEEPPMRCTVPWCYLLRGFGEEEDVNCLRVFEWIKESFDTPVCEDDVFPTEGATKFIKLNATHHHTESTRFEATCPIEPPGHYGNVILVAETTPPLTSIDAEVSGTDNLYVIKQVSNDESDFEMIAVFERLRNLEHPNLIRHFWIAEYCDHTNICIQYIPGDTLEVQLQRRMLFDPIMVLQMMKEILNAVDFLHSHGIIYLYWSLGNILLDGLHRRLILNNLTLSVTDDGNYDEGYTKQSLPPSLVPPEMLEGDLLKHDSDCWGAACVMVHLLTGHQIWYSQRHDPRERLWEQVKSGLCPFSSEEVKIKQARLLALLKACFKVKLDQRMSFPELLRRVKATADDGNFDHLFDRES